MLTPFDPATVARLRSLLDGEHHQPRLVAVLAGLPSDAVFRIVPEDVALPQRTLRWREVTQSGVEIPRVAHIGQRLNNVLVDALQRAQEAGRLQPGHAIFEPPAKPPHTADWPVWVWAFLAPAHRRRHAAWQIAIAGGSRASKEPPTHRGLERFARMIADFWTDRMETDSSDPEGIVAWEVGARGGALALVPRSPTRLSR